MIFNGLTSGTSAFWMYVGVGKSSLANTFARFLKNPKDDPVKVLTKDNPDLLRTQVMELFDGLSINKMKDLSVQVEELTPSVKLVKLDLPAKVEEPNLPESEESESEEPPEFQLKMVDMGGHTATSLKAFHFHSTI